VCFPSSAITVERGAFCSVFEQPHFGQTPLSSVQPQPQLLHSGAWGFGTGRVSTSGSQPPPLEVEEEEEDDDDEEELDPLALLVDDGLLVEDVLLADEVLLGDDVLLVLLVEEVLLVLLDEVLLVEDVLLVDEVLLIDDVLLGDDVLLVEEVLLDEELELSDDPMGGSVELLLLLLLDELEELDEGMDMDLQIPQGSPKRQLHRTTPQTESATARLYLGERQLL